AGTAERAVVDDDVVLDECASDEPVATLAEIAVHVNTDGGVVVATVAAQHGAIAAVGDVDAMLCAAGVALVVLQHRVVGEIREHAPRCIAAEMPVAYRDVRTLVDAHPGTRCIGGIQPVNHEPL